MHGVKTAVPDERALQAIFVNCLSCLLRVIDMYYDIDRACSYNEPFNMILGGRGIGKTYSWKKKAIRAFLKNGIQFAYIRRYDSELQQVADTLFNDIIFNEEFPGHDIKYEKGVWKVDKEVAGFPFALTRNKDYKSASYPRINNLLFDEFLVENGRSAYLKREPFKLFDLYETIARMRDNVVLFMMANTISKANPYFLEWNLMPQKDKEFIVRNHILLQIVPVDNEFRETKNSTRFGEMSRALGYADYSVDNNFYVDTDVQTFSKTKSSRYMFSFVWKGKTYGFWFDYKSGYNIISYDYDSYSTRIFTLDKESVSATVNYINEYSKHPYFAKIRQSFCNGTLRYEHEKIQHEIKDMLVLLL